MPTLKQEFSLSSGYKNWLLTHKRTSLVAQLVKNLPEMQENWVRFLGQEDPLEKEVATHCSILAWRIPRTEEPGRLQSMESQVRHDLATQPPSPPIHKNCQLSLACQKVCPLHLQYIHCLSSLLPWIHPFWNILRLEILLQKIWVFPTQTATTQHNPRQMLIIRYSWVCSETAQVSMNMITSVWAGTILSQVTLKFSLWSYCDDKKMFGK